MIPFVHIILVQPCQEQSVLCLEGEFVWVAKKTTQIFTGRSFKWKEASYNKFIRPIEVVSFHFQC